MENTNLNDQTADILKVGGQLVSLISSVINGTAVDCSAFSDCDFNKLFKLAEMHKVTALTAVAVKKLALVPKDIKAEFEKQLFRTAARHTAQERETKELSSLFTSNNIEHCFLKGTKVSAFYDEPDMRFMLDLDIYINPDKAQEAEALMIERGYEKTSNDPKDTGFSKLPFLNAELHRELKYDYDVGCDFYKDAYKKLIPADGDTKELKMTNEDFYVYILSHTAHHFGVSGTGIRSIVDHYYLVKKLLPLCDADVLSENLKQSGLAQFNKKLTDLSEYWFCGAEADELTKTTADYIILSGVFGNEKNSYINGVLRRGLEDKKSAYFRSRIFPSFEFMCINYPVLKKAAFLLPLCWVIRIIKSLFSRKRIASEAKAVKSVEDSEKEIRAEFLSSLGL